MSLTLEIVSEQRRTPGVRTTVTFGQAGGTIGRSPDSDLPLPDAKRFISARHASIDFHSGSYYIVDTSKNGVFVNGADEAVGRGKPQRLFPGDRVRIGEYELQVSIDDEDDTGESLFGTSHVDPVDLKERVESPDPTGYDLVDAHIITGVGIEMQLEEDDPDACFELALGDGSEDDASRVTSIQAGIAAPGGPMHAFFAGAGVEAPKLTAKQAEKLMGELGRLTRELVTGVVEGLRLRALQKAELKQSNTFIGPKANNPLKFSANVDEALTRLFLNRSEEYMRPAEAAHDAVSDLTAHQRSLLKAMREAVDEYLERLEPERIERGAADGRVGALISVANRNRYWEIYKDVYSVLASRAPDELPQAFLEELAKAYERAAAREAMDRTSLKVG